MGGLSRLLDSGLRFLPMLAMFALAGGTFWLVQANAPSPMAERPKRHIAGYYAEGFSASVLSETGATKYRLQGDRLVSFEDDGGMEVQRPAIRGFRPGQPDVTLRAQRGTMTGDLTRVELFDRATLTREPGPTTEAMRADSDYFLVLVNDDIIRSDKPTVLHAGQSVMSGSSMVFNNINREIQLGGSVRGMIEPNAGRKKDGSP